MRFNVNAYEKVYPRSQVTQPTPDEITEQEDCMVEEPKKPEEPKIIEKEVSDNGSTGTDKLDSE